MPILGRTPRPYPESPGRAGRADRPRTRYARALPRVLVVTNPKSRQNRRDPRLTRDLAEILGPMGRVVAPESPAALREALVAARAEGVEVVAVNGGDGSAHVVLTQLVAVFGPALPAVALLRGGTMNTVASGLGVRGATRAILRRIVARLQAGAPLPTVTRSLLRVGDEAPQYGFLFGNGLIANFLEVYYEGSEPSPSKALWILGRGILSAFVNGPAIRRLMRPIHLDWEVDGRRSPRRDHLAIGAGTVDDVGFRFRPFFLAPTHPGRLHLLAIACTPLRFVWELPRIWTARPPTSPDIHSALPTAFVLRADRPIAYMIDGDFHSGGAELKVEVGPEVRMVVA